MTPATGSPDLSRADDDGTAGPYVTEPLIQTIPVHEQDSLRAIRTIIDTLSPASLAALTSLANSRLDDRDPRKIRAAEVSSLRQLAAKAHAMDAGTDRMVRALEGIVRRYD